MVIDNDLIPNVSGISPSEGPPGTKITIRGHNLGKDENDLLSVHICDYDCTKYSKWISSGKIICEVISDKITKSISGPVIVRTKSGGDGISGINFYISLNKLKALTYSSIWIDEEYEGSINNNDIIMELDINEIIHEADPLGILPGNVYSSGTPIHHESVIQYSSKLVDSSFNSIRFLLDRHGNTKWEYLKKGHEELKKILKIREGGGSIEITDSNNYLTKNISMVINVISDMNKLLKLTNIERFYIQDLKIKIEQLNNNINIKFKQLGIIYSKMISYILFIDIYNNNYKFFHLPKMIHSCIINKKYDYLECLNLCLEFDKKVFHNTSNIPANLTGNNNAIHANITGTNNVIHANITGNNNVIHANITGNNNVIPANSSNINSNTISSNINTNMSICSSVGVGVGCNMGSSGVSLGNEIYLKNIYNYINECIIKYKEYLISNLSLIYPLYISSIIDLMKKLENFKEKNDYSINIISTHLCWLKEKCESFKYNIINNIKRKIINKRNIYNNELNIKIKNFLIEFNIFFTREYIIATSIIETKSIEYKKNITSNKKNLIIKQLNNINDTFILYFELYFNLLKNILFTMWNINNISCTYKDIFITLTILPINYVIQIYNSIINTSICIRNLPVNQLMIYLFNEKSDQISSSSSNTTITTCSSLTYLMNYFDKFSNLIFDTFILLRKFYLYKLKKLLSFKNSINTTNTSSGDEYNIYEEIYYSYYKEIYNKNSIEICKIIVEWLNLYREILEEVSYNKIADERLAIKLDNISPINFINIIIQEKIDIFLNNNIKKIQYLIYYYNYLYNILVCLYDNILSSPILVNWPSNLPMTCDKFLNSLKFDISNSINYLNKTLLIRICELLLKPTLTILQSDYFIVIQ